MIHPQRIMNLNALPAARGDYVLYWMQQSQRAQCNHALEYACGLGNQLGVPVVVLFGITDAYPEANERHYAFMLEGLARTSKSLEARGVQLLIRHLSPELAAVELSKRASVVVVDRGYLRIQRQWRSHVAQNAACGVVQVESDVIVPVDETSQKEEFAARTIRPRIHRRLAEFATPLGEMQVKRPSVGLDLGFKDALDLSDVDGVLAKLRIDRSVPRSRHFQGGYEQADRLLTAFLERKLKGYDADRNEPSFDGVSHMSPYLHFGQISPLEILLRTRASLAPDPAKEVYVEELLVRRELSMNFVLHNTKYDQYDCLPAWAQTTLREHAKDKRDRLYSLDEFERSKTHDPYWNAAQREMVVTGKMHNYMRMYWGKKILEWTPGPQEGFRIALHLNNKYELDGRDANSYAGVAWIFGKHDRPWIKRPVFGTIRYMNDSGLKRKCDIDAYVKKVALLAGDEPVGESLFG